MRSNGALLGNFLILGGIAPEIFFPVALMVNGLCRPRRTWQRPLSPLDCRLDNSTDRPWHRRDNCPAKNTIKFSGALLRGDGGPALLDIRAAAIRAAHLAFVIVDQSQSPRKGFLARMAEKFVVGHANLPRKERLKEF